jgi:drug/metabolite transporter (DMT)-like permease
MSGASAAGGAGDRAARLGARWRGLPDVTKGFALAGIGIVVLSPDALLIRLMTVDEGTLLFFRGALSVFGYLLLIRIHGGAVGTRRTWVLTRPELAIAVLMLLANVFFVTSIRNTNAALALVIISSAPAFTAVLSSLVGESISRRTWISSLVVLGGVGAIFATQPQGGELLGTLAAVGASITLAVSLVVRRRAPSVRMLPTLAVGAVLTALVAAPFASPWSTSASDLGLALIMGLVVLPVSLDLIWRAPRYITAPEVSLVSLMEAVLGPLWILLIIGEAPTVAAVLAGVVIIGTLATHAVLTQRELGAEARAP